MLTTPYMLTRFRRFEKATYVTPDCIYCILTCKCQKIQSYFKVPYHYFSATDCFEVTCNYDSMVVEVMPNLFGMSGNDTVFANGAEWVSVVNGTDSFIYNQPLGDAHQTIGINNSTDMLTVDVDFGVSLKFLNQKVK